MLDPQTYRISEQLAKAQTPSWRISQIHNLDHFERAGFPVRLGSIRELGQIIDTMQENRFEKYMTELHGLSESEYRLVLEACQDIVRFQLTYLPHRPVVLPISTLISAFALYQKLNGAKPYFESVLEIGPGCGYLSFFLRHYKSLKNYAQIEACESFYILQNLVNIYSFGPDFDERALPPAEFRAADYFTNARPDVELSPRLRLDGRRPRCVHYPWWRIGELITNDVMFDIVTSNANLLEFNEPALDDYLALMHRCLKPDGIFLVQCTGFAANGTVEQLLDKIHGKGFAPLIFVLESVPIQFPGKRSSVAELGNGVSSTVTFTTNNALFVRAGHPLFEKYFDRRNYHHNFISSEPIVRDTFFSRPPAARRYATSVFVEETEKAICASNDASLKRPAVKTAAVA